MGKNKLPDKVKEIRGTAQPCRKSDFNIQEIGKLPAPPKYFSKSAKVIYKTIGSGLVASKVLTPSNLPLFVAYCNEMAIYYDANEKLKNLDSRVEKMTNESGSRTFVSGMQKIAKLAIDNATKLGREFGLTAASVSRVTIAIKKEDDPFAKFLNS